MKFCKDCVHYQLPFEGAPLHTGLCSRKLMPLDLVSGEPERTGNTAYKHPFCKAERVSLPGNCGHDALHFKAKDVPHV